MLKLALKKNFGLHTPSTIIVALFLCVLVLNVVNFSTVGANSLNNRSISLSTDQPGQIATHNYSFFMPTTDTLGSIVFRYCTNSAIFADPCSAPAGLDVTAANISSEVGNTGFSIDGSTMANQLVITRPPLSASVITTKFSFDNITNPSAIDQTVFVRISTYASSDGSGPIIHSGAVAFVTASVFNVSAFIPPYLRLCVGISVAVDCSSIAGDSLNLGNLSAGHANAGQSQLAVGTNSSSGYSLFSLGTTMTSGNDVISSLSTPTPSFPGNNQFGINLRANSNPSSGADPSGSGVAVPTPNYNVPNLFVFTPGDEIANSALPTDYNRMTVSYLANVNAGQPIGIYSTTITYVAVAQF